MRPNRFTLMVMLTTAGWQMNFGFAADSAANPPIPSGPPATVDLDGSIQPPVEPAEPQHIVQPAPAVPATAPSGQLSNDVIVWDSEQKEETITAGTLEAHFKFNLTNVSPDTVTIFSVHSSCGCTTARLPPMPWKLAPGTNCEINVTMNVAGKNGTVFKTVTVSTDKGNKILTVRTTIVQPPPAGASTRELEHRGQSAPADLHTVKRDPNRASRNVSMIPSKTRSFMATLVKAQGGLLTDTPIAPPVDCPIKAVPV